MIKCPDDFFHEISHYRNKLFFVDCVPLVAGNQINKNPFAIQLSQYRFNHYRLLF